MSIAVLPTRLAADPIVARAVEAVGAVAVSEGDLSTALAAIVDTADPTANNAGQLLSARIGVLAIVDAFKESELWPFDFVQRSYMGEELLPRLQRLLRDRRRSADAQRGLAMLVELTAQYAETTAVEDILHVVTRRLAEELNIDRAALVAVDEQTRYGYIVAASDDESMKNLRIELERYPEIREVVRTKRPVIVEDAPTHPLFEMVREQVAARGIQHVAALPLAIAGEVLGVLLLRRSSDPGAFRRREIDLLTTVSHATAVALKNARRFSALSGQTETEKQARLLAEERAQALERYASYFEHLSEAVAIIDSSYRLISLNPAGFRLFDLHPGEAIGRHINTVMNPIEGTTMVAALNRVMRLEAQPDFDVVARTVLGRRLVVSVTAAPLAEADAAAIVAMRDVTAHRHMADELRKTKEFLERLIDSSVDGIIAADMKGKVVLFNKAAETITGYSAEDARHLSVRQLYPDDQSRDIMTKLRSPDFGGRGRLTVSRAELLHKSGERIPVSMTAAIVYEGDQEVATVGIFADQRDRLRLEQKLTQAEQRLEETERQALLVAVAGAAAHELNQPLTSVMGYAELLKRKIPEGDPNARAVDIMHREAERMAEIVKKIGKITRFETKHYVLNQRIVDLDRAASSDD